MAAETINDMVTRLYDLINGPDSPLSRDQKFDLLATLGSWREMWKGQENLKANVGRPLAIELLSEKSLLRDPTTAMVEFLIRLVGEIPRKPPYAYRPPE